MSQYLVCLNKDCKNSLNFLNVQRREHVGHEIIDLNVIKQNGQHLTDEISDLAQRANEMLNIDQLQRQMINKVKTYCSKRKRFLQNSPIYKQFQLLNYLLSSPNLDQIQDYSSILETLKEPSRIMREFQEIFLDQSEISQNLIQQKIKQEIDSSLQKLKTDMRIRSKITIQDETNHVNPQNILNQNQLVQLEQIQIGAQVQINNITPIDMQAEIMLERFGQKYHSLPLQSEVPYQEYEPLLLQAKNELMRIPSASQAFIENPHTQMAILKVLLFEYKKRKMIPLLSLEVGARYLRRLIGLDYHLEQSDSEVLIQQVCHIANQIFGECSPHKGRFLVFFGNLILREFRQSLFQYEKEIFEEGIRLLTHYKDSPLVEVARVDLAIAVYKSGRQDEGIQLIESCLNQETWCVRHPDAEGILKTRKLILWGAIWLENFRPVHPKVHEYKAELESLGGYYWGI